MADNQINNGLNNVKSLSFSCKWNLEAGSPGWLWHCSPLSPQGSRPIWAHLSSLSSLSLALSRSSFGPNDRRWQQPYFRQHDEGGNKNKKVKGIYGEENGKPLQYSCLENPTDREAWWVTVHWVTKSQTWLRDWVRGTYQLCFKDDSKIYHRILQFSPCWPELSHMAMPRYKNKIKNPEKCNYLVQLKIKVSFAPKEEKTGLGRVLTVPMPAFCIEFLPPILPNSLLFYTTTNTSKSSSVETFQARNLSVSLSFIFI